MSIEGVLVSFQLEGKDQTYETSGTLFNSDVLLMTGTSLNPLLQEKDWVSSFMKSTSSRVEANEFLDKISFRVFTQKGSDKFGSIEGKATSAWKCPLITKSLKLFRDWTLGPVNFESESKVLSSDDFELSKELMSIFLLVKCKCGGKLERTEENNTPNDDVRVLLQLLSSLHRPNRGQDVEVVSTPFGNEHFVNSLSRGVISTVVGCEKCIILCDARTVSGCEGGPIFLSERSRKENEKHKLLGVVTCPLTWWRGEWVGFTIGISLLPVLRRLLGAEDCRWPVEDLSGFGAGINYEVAGSKEHLAEPCNLIILKDLSELNFIDETVVLVRSELSWGSGVVLNAALGIIVTCSHVFKDNEIICIYHKGQKHSGDVVFKTQDDIPYDLAIIKAGKTFTTQAEAKFPKNPPKVGETVVAAGFPFFSDREDPSIRPSIATGCIARVNPYMIQTTCCIQSGFSGGPLLRNGELIGIIISNAQKGPIFPHINFIVPSSVFKEPVLKYIKTNDRRSLMDLECLDVKVQTVWKLQTSKL